MKRFGFREFIIRIRPQRRAVTGLVTVLSIALLTGCSGYQLQGKVVEGTASAVLVVDADDPRLEEPGVAGALVELTLDPHRLSAKDAGSEITDREGRFAIPIQETGAGFLEYDVQVAVRSEGFQPARRQIRLPGSRQRVLVVMNPGGNGGNSEPQENFLQETLRLGEPYMN